MLAAAELVEQEDVYAVGRVGRGYLAALCRGGIGRDGSADA